jgi:catechol 2,3-dioxygenase-like lactoylglutathione lyase family enzyme
MEAIIANMLKRFESGALNRRELIQGLAMLATAGATAAEAAAVQGPPPAFTSPTIDHISIQVTDLPRSIAFYQNIFGMKVVSEDKPNEIVRLGINKTRVSLHHKSPYALMDHFAIGVDPFNKDAVTKHLKAHGLTPEENIDAGFHVKDPEGIRVQIVQADKA